MLHILLTSKLQGSFVGQGISIKIPQWIVKTRLNKFKILIKTVLVLLESQCNLLMSMK